jgi:hypothetical protein
LRFLFPANVTLGATIPAGPLTQSFVLELILTALLMFVILGVSTGAREKGITAGIVVGSVIGLEAMFRRPDLRRIDESSALARPSRCQPPSAKPLGLSARTQHRRPSWSSRLPLCPRTRLLLSLNTQLLLRDQPSGQPRTVERFILMIC